MKKFVYLDNAQTTSISAEVVEAMKPYNTDYFGNPSASYEYALYSAKAIDLQRAQVASVIGAKPEEIYFTSGGSESDNWALMSQALLHPGGHIITSQVEHHAILNTCKALEKLGTQVTYLGVDESGKINLQELEDAIRPDTFMVSIMAANNEIGTIERTKIYGYLCRKKNIIFHTDAVQALGHIPIDVNKMYIDMLSASAHKFHGPKGVGFLYVRDGIRMIPLIHGGHQENGLRAGTENVPGIVGLGEAAKIANDNMEHNNMVTERMREYLIGRIISEIPGVRLNGSRYVRLPNNINITIDGVDGITAVMMLSSYGICVSTGSACTSDSDEPSHVLTAIGLTPEEADCTIRITIDESLTPQDARYFIESLKTVVQTIRG